MTIAEPSPLLAECRSYSEVASTHTHPFAQLILPLQGAMVLKTPTYQFQLDNSRLFFLPPECRHTFFARMTNQFLVLDIAPHLLLPNNTGRLVEELTPLMDDRWQALRTLLLAEVNRQPAGQGLLDLFRYAYTHLLQPVQRPRSLQYLHDHFHESLDLAFLAALEGFNPTYYSEWFKKITGQTVTAYIQQLRLELAKTLLVETNLPILHIAQQVGYEHHASLTRLFQQHDRLTPATYRRQNQKPAKK